VRRRIQAAHWADFRLTGCFVGSKFSEPQGFDKKNLNKTVGEMLLGRGKQLINDGEMYAVEVKKTGLGCLD
jgi:hypothetical protein